MENIIIGFAGVILGALLTFIKDLFNLHLSRKERTRYLAVRVTFTIEKFVNDCLDIARDDGRIMGPDEQGCIQFYTSYASISFDSLDVDWKSLPLDLMYEILNLPSQIELAIDKINITAEYGSGPPDYKEETEERRLQHVKLGLMADNLSGRLREKYKLPKKTRELVGYLNEIQMEIEKMRGDQEEHQAKNIMF
jgi:hypothetical protein